MLKLAITGTHSTGKTTLALALASKLGIPYLQGDPIRAIMGARFPGRLLKNLSKAERWELERIGLKSRLTIESTAQNFISDGCTLNSIAYALAYCGNEIKTAPDYQMFERSALSNARTYTHILYLPPEILFEHDGFRPDSNKLREAVDGILRNILCKFQSYMVTGSVEERVAWSIMALENPEFHNIGFSNLMAER